MAGIIKVDRVQSDSNLAFNIAGANVAFMDASALRLVGSGITANGTTIVSGGKVVTAAQPTGSVLQVVQVVKTDTFSTSSAPFTDITGLSVSITPSSTSSKILITYTTNICSDVSATGYGVRLVRDSTPIFVGDLAGSRPQATMSGASINNYSATPVSGQYVDSPSTISTLTYKLQISCTNGTPALYVNRSINDRNSTYYDARTASSIVLMEIAG